jgi:hypothetical protein
VREKHKLGFELIVWTQTEAVERCPRERLRGSTQHIIYQRKMKFDMNE